jgi:hypothetical protein
VLIRAGGWFPGVMALVTVVIIGSHGCCERIVTRKVCKFVPSTVWNVHVTDPAAVGSPWRSMVRVPLQVPSRKDLDAEGPVGPASLPHAAASNINDSAIHLRDVCRVIANLQIG